MNNKVKKVLSLSLLFAVTACGNNTSSSSLFSSSKTSESTSTVNGSSNSELNNSSSISSSIEAPSSSSSNSISSSSSVVDEERDRIIAAIELGVSNKSKVKSGILTYKTTTTTTTEYEYGTDSYGDFSHLILEDSDEYYGYNKAGLQYGIRKELRNISRINIDEGSFKINGPEIKPYNQATYGAEGYMTYMLEMLKENKNRDYKSLKEEGKYKFSVGYAQTVGTKNYVWVNTVVFELENDAFKNISVTMEKYSNVTVIYAPYSFVIKPDSKPVTTYTIDYTQVIGDKDATNPYDIETLYFDSFDLVGDTSVTLGDNFSFMAGNAPEFSIANASPSTANVDIDLINFEVLEGSSDINGSYNRLTKKFKFSCGIPGKYKVKLSTYRFEKVIDITVTDPLPEKLAVTSYISSGGHYNANMIEEGKVINVYAGSEIYFAPSITPSLADQSTTFEVTSDNKDKVTLDYKELKVNDTGKVANAYEFKTFEVGVYNITIKSSINSQLSISFQINVIEVPPLEKLLSQRYVQLNALTANLDVDIQFIPQADDITKGIVTIHDEYSMDDDIDGTYDYVYDSLTRTFALTVKDGSTMRVGLSFDGEYNINLHRISNNVIVSLRVFSLTMMLTNASWNGSNHSTEYLEWFIYKFKTATTGTFEYIKNDRNFNSQNNVTFSCGINFTIEEREEGYEIIFDQTSIDVILKKVEKITAIKNILIAKNFKSIVSIYEIDGVETTIVHNRTRE